jgi:hypothetical protein
MNQQPASEAITVVVSSWPGVRVDREEIGETAFFVGPRQLGHLHGDGAAHFSFPKAQWLELRAAGRIEPHPVFPDKTGPAARRIENRADVDDVIDLFRLTYDRVVSRHGVPSAARQPRSAE